MESTFVETDCVVEHEGRKFEAGGAWLCDCTDGFRRGVVYARPADPIKSRPGDSTGPAPSYPRRGEVTDWHGNKIADAHFGSAYFGGFGARMRSVTFTVAGVTYSGRYGIDGGNAVRVKSTKRVK